MKTLIITIISAYIVYGIVRIIYFNRKFKRDSKYPCFVVISQDGFISKPMYYDDAKAYSDSIYGYIKVDRDEYNRLKTEENKNNI